jgi:hypothetical protein
MFRLELARRRRRRRRAFHEHLFDPDLGRINLELVPFATEKRHGDKERKGDTSGEEGWFSLLSEKKKGV